MSIITPDSRFVFRHPAHCIAFGGGAGLSPAAPGTVGTLLAFPLFHLVAPRVDAWTFLLIVVALLPVIYAGSALA